MPTAMCAPVPLCHHGLCLLLLSLLSQLLLCKSVKKQIFGEEKKVDKELGGCSAWSAVPLPAAVPLKGEPTPVGQHQHPSAEPGVQEEKNISLSPAWKEKLGKQQRFLLAVPVMPELF